MSTSVANRNTIKNQENFEEFLREILEKNTIKNQENFHKKIGIFFKRNIEKKKEKEKEKSRKFSICHKILKKYSSLKKIVI